MMHVLCVRIDLNAVLRIQYSNRERSGKFEPLQLEHAQTILRGFEVASSVAQCGAWDADLLYMSERSVQRYLSLFHSTRSAARIVLVALGEQFPFTVTNPSAFLHEIQAQLYDSTCKWIHASTICRTIHQHNFTHKKIQVIALQ